TVRRAAGGAEDAFGALEERARTVEPASLLEEALRRRAVPSPRLADGEEAGVQRLVPGTLGFAHRVAEEVDALVQPAERDEDGAARPADGRHPAEARERLARVAVGLVE